MTNALCRPLQVQRRHTLDAPPCTCTGRPSASTDKPSLADGGRHRQSVSATAAQFGLTLCVVRCRCNRGTLSGRRHHRPAIRLDRQVISPGSWGAAPPICACFGCTVGSYALCPLLQVQLRLTLGASQYICIRPMNVLHSELCKHHRRNTDSWPVSAIMKQQTSATSCRQY